MTRTVEFDYLSPFAYLGSVAAPAVCERNGAELRFKPVLFAGLLNHFGQLGPAEIPPKALHAFLATLRHARVHGVPLRSPRFHPFKPLTALRATLAAETNEDRGRVAQALFAYGWAEGGDLGDPDEIAATLTAAGLDGPALVERAGTDAIKTLLKAETDAAIARGVFGIPTFIVEEELYWGLDQLGYVALHLEGKNPTAGVDLASLAPRGSSAQRTVALDVGLACRIITRDGKAHLFGDHVARRVREGRARQVRVDRAGRGSARVRHVTRAVCAVTRFGRRRRRFSRGRGGPHRL